MWWIFFHFQINGIDVSGLSHHEVRELLLKSQEENIVAELRNLNNYKTNCKLKDRLVFEVPRRSSVSSSPAKSAVSSPSNSISNRKISSIGVQTDNLNVIDVDTYEPEEHLVVEQYLPSETDVEVSWFLSSPCLPQRNPLPLPLYLHNLNCYYFLLFTGIHSTSETKQNGLNN